MGFGTGTMLEMANILTTSDHTSLVSITLFVTLVYACIVIGHLLEENRWMNESITALIIGVGTGGVILLISRGKSSHLMAFSEDLFCFYLLPPIIFNAGQVQCLFRHAFSFRIDSLEKFGERISFMRSELKDKIYTVGRSSV